MKYLGIPRLLATGLYSGFAPVSGTAGSAVCVVLWCLYPPSGQPYLQLVTTMVIAVLGLWATEAYLTELASEGKLSGPKIDPSSVVIDEWLGMWIALLAASPARPWTVVAAFLLFRFFDIMKPGLVRRAESLPRAWGIMADDFLAGLLAWVVLEAFSPLLP